MAKATLNLFIAELSGTMGDFVFKKSQTPGEVIIARRPKKSKVPPSEAQTAHRLRFGAASTYAKAALADPVARAYYEKLAEAQGKTPFAVAREAYLTGKDLLA
jgi:hypothetical protein